MLTGCSGTPVLALRAPACRARSAGKSRRKSKAVEEGRRWDTRTWRISQAYAIQLQRRLVACCSRAAGASGRVRSRGVSSSQADTRRRRQRHVPGQLPAQHMDGSGRQRRACGGPRPAQLLMQQLPPSSRSRKRQATPLTPGRPGGVCALPSAICMPPKSKACALLQVQTISKFLSMPGVAWGTLSWPRCVAGKMWRIMRVNNFLLAGAIIFMVWRARKMQWHIQSLPFPPWSALTSSSCAGPCCYHRAGHSSLHIGVNILNNINRLYSSVLSEHPCSGGENIMQHRVHQHCAWMNAI